MSLISKWFSFEVSSNSVASASCFRAAATVFAFNHLIQSVKGTDPDKIATHKTIVRLIAVLHIS
jgi:hypothetical protein